jgi:single-strand DNA-binding protein
MASLNKVQLIGHLGADPEVRRTQAGDPVVSFRLATSESWKDKASGERKERTDWHTVVIFNAGLGEIAEKYLRKGSKAYVEGELKTRKWVAQDGSDRWSTEVVLTAYRGSILLLDKAERAPPSPDHYGSQPATRPAATASATPADLDDDIPF